MGFKKEKFPDKLIEEILDEFKNIINEKGEQEFREWLVYLNFQIPEPFKNNMRASDNYDNYKDWIENEIVNLENETGLSWEYQSEDIVNVNFEVRKTQLVLRQNKG